MIGSASIVNIGQKTPEKPPINRLLEPRPVPPVRSAEQPSGVRQWRRRASASTARSRCNGQAARQRAARNSAANARSANRAAGRKSARQSAARSAAADERTGTAAATAAGIARPSTARNTRAWIVRTANTLSRQRSRHRRSSGFGAGCDSRRTDSAGDNVAFSLANLTYVHLQCDDSSQHVK